MILREGTINVSAVNCFGDAVALRGCYHTDKSLHRCTVHIHATPQLRRNYCDFLLPLDLDLTAVTGVTRELQRSPREVRGVVFSRIICEMIK